MALNYSLTRTVAPAAEPISLSDLKSALRVDHTNDDDELTLIIESARAAVERDTGRSLISQTWQLKLDYWPSELITLYHGPVQSVTSIAYVDSAGDSQTWDSANYDVDTASQPGFVRLAYDASWPTTRGTARCITVTYVAGYGDEAADVPYELVQAVILNARLQYDGQTPDVQTAYDRLVAGNSVGVYP